MEFLAWIYLWLLIMATAIGCIYILASLVSSHRARRIHITDNWHPMRDRGMRCQCETMAVWHSQPEPQPEPTRYEITGEIPAFLRQQAH